MLKGKTDKKLRSAMTKESYELPESYQERVKQTLASLPERSSKRRRYRRGAVAFVPLFAVLLVVSTVSAGSLIEEHLNQMSKDETQKYLDTVDNYLYIQEDSYTRELTDKERERLQELNWAYAEGTFPEAELPIYDTAEQAGDTLYCYIAESGTFKLPDTELTDEQLLQLIDFREKREYSMKQKWRSASEPTEEPVIIGVTEEEAVENARQSLERFYQVDISEYKVITEIIGTSYSIEFKKDGNRYVAMIDMESGQIGQLGYDVSGGLNMDDCPLEETLLTETYNTTRKALEKYLPTESTITRGCYVYKGNDTVIRRGMAHYVFEDSEGNGYDLVYSFNENWIYSITQYSDYSATLLCFDEDGEENTINNEVVSWSIIDME